MRRLIPVLCLVGCLWAPASARADQEQTVKATGGMTVSWHGEPARGCAEQGVCDVRGAVVLDPDPDPGTVGWSGPDDNSIVGFDVGMLPPIARVIRGPASDPAGSCTDGLGSAQLTFAPSGRRGRTVVLKPSLGYDPSVVSAGRCAGPTTADLAEALPPLRVARSDFRRPKQRVDFTFQRTLGAGPFTVAIDSTVKFTVLRKQVRSDDDDEPARDLGDSSPEIRTRRLTLLTLRYVLEGGDAPMATSFSGLAGRGCELLDACGLSGTSTLALSGVRGTRIELQAEGPASLARGGGTRRALAALAAGRMTLQGGDSPGTLRGRFASEARRDGSAAVCRDGRDVELPPFFLIVGRRTSELAIGGRQRYGGPSDALRTRCPGPGTPAGDAVAAGSFPTSELTADRLTVPLELAPGDSWPFAVSTTATTSLTLRRVSARVRVVRGYVG